MDGCWCNTECKLNKVFHYSIFASMFNSIEMYLNDIKDLDWIGFIPMSHNSEIGLIAFVNLEM